MAFIQKQFIRPKGFAGEHLMPRLWNRWNRALHETAFQSLDIQPADRVLEIGFGGGSLIGRIHSVLQTGLIAGVDHSRAVCRHCTRRFRHVLPEGRIALGCAEAGGLPFRSATFDKVFSVNSVFYWKNIPWAFREIARVLRPDGVHILVFTDPRSLQDRPVVKQAVTGVSVSDLSGDLSGAGFVLIDTMRDHDLHRSFYCITARRFQPMTG